MATIIAMCVHKVCTRVRWWWFRGLHFIFFITLVTFELLHCKFGSDHRTLQDTIEQSFFNRWLSNYCIFTIWGTWLSTVQWTFLLSMIDSEPKQYTNHYEAAAWQGLKLEKLKIQRGSSSSSFFANVIHGSYSQTTHLFLEHNFTYLVLKRL